MNVIGQNIGIFYTDEDWKDAVYKNIIQDNQDIVLSYSKNHIIMNYGVEITFLKVRSDTRETFDRVFYQNDLSINDIQFVRRHCRPIWPIPLKVD